MLLQVADNIRQCLDHAADSRERARTERDPGRKAELNGGALASLGGELPRSRAARTIQFSHQA
jgi:hypothetical protein